MTNTCTKSDYNGLTQFTDSTWQENTYRKHTAYVKRPVLLKGALAAPSPLITPPTAPGGISVALAAVIIGNYVGWRASRCKSLITSARASKFIQQSRVNCDIKGERKNSKLV